MQPLSPPGALRDPDEDRCHCHGTLLSKLPGLLWAVTGNLSLSMPGPVGQRETGQERSQGRWPHCKAPKGHTF